MVCRYTLNTEWFGLAATPGAPASGCSASRGPAAITIATMSPTANPATMSAAPVACHPVGRLIDS